MKLLINHNEEVYDGNELSLTDLLRKKELTFKRLLIRLNGMVVKDDEKSNIVLKNGDSLDIVRIISGG